MSNVHILPQPNPADDQRSPVPEPAAEQAFEPVPFPSPQPDAEPIGAPLEEIRAELISYGTKLGEQLTDPGASFVRDAMRVLEHQVCQIAVVGQVKSRQSAFIGALIGSPDLLPTEFSPWSTALLRLHFGKQAPGAVAEFQLFERKDWDELANGSARIRELTNQLVPGFEPELLRRHLDAMRQRAEKRFGENFDGLLGAKHAYDEISSDLLARYVGPGSSAADASEGPGQFADLTKSADLWLSEGPFKFPVTVIATPGINDPFLVRDEITRHALEPAELYVFLMSARHPLTTTELATLRVLRGLHRERILVFIDHIDELRDPANEVRAIITNVRQALAKEFPALDIPIVAGSSKWATEAQQAEKLTISEVLTPALRAYAKHKGALRAADVKSNGSGSPTEELPSGQVGRILTICSGFPELRRELTKLLLTSHSAHLIRQIAAYFAELAQVNEGSVREEMVKLAIVSESATNTASRETEELKSVKRELARIQSVAGELERNLAAYQNLLNDAVADYRSRLYTGLARILEEFAREQGNELLTAFVENRAKRHWRCYTKILRQRAEEELHAARRAVEEALAATPHNVFPALRETMLRRAPNLSLPEAPSSYLGPTSVRVPVEDSIAFDLAAPGSLVSWSRGRTPEEHAAELERMLIDEFMPAMDEVIRLATAELQRETGEFADRATAIAVAVIDALRSQSEGYIAQAKVLLDAREARPQLEVDPETRLQVLRDRLNVSEVLSRRLADLSSRCNALVT